MRKTFIVALITVAVLTGCTTGLTAVKIIGQAYLNREIAARCPTPGQCSDVLTEANALIDTIISDLRNTDVTPEQRAIARNALSNLLVSRLSISKLDADLIVNALGDLLVAELKDRRMM